MDWYINIDSIPVGELECIGYYVVYEDDKFVLLNNKGDEYLLDKRGPKHLKVDDEEAGVLESRWRIPKRRVPAPLKKANSN